jgi:Transposase zinc-ribbon domain
MPVLSYVHQLFNAEQCQAYIHTLRWKDRPLQCPRCHSHNVGPWDFLPFVNHHLLIFYLICTPGSRRIRLTS